ncbi:DJ-1/PfpI family protein [Fictibacillus enclensis]|uniref:DJ-1/PfpI family protein n=1 Tax=Fictibacillus enclensis TaxID=1017270 RepID=UPI0025A16E56|nr:DJ-1/PfpI family protein [Fictibacillus enclensis]MDM5336954.1 DJ-1/PfpI family protein [Fictibacillus enclensis]
MKKRVLVYLYPQFREVEIVVALSVLSRHYEILSFSLPHGGITSECGLLVHPTIKLKNINPLEYDLLLLPGGRQAASQSDARLIRLIKGFDRDGVRIAAIGLGVLIAGKAGILENKSYSAPHMEEENRKVKEWLTGRAVNRQVVEDKNIITAKNNAYIDFGLLIGDRLGCFSSIDDYNLYKGTL